MIAILFFMYKMVLDTLFLQSSYMKRSESCFKQCHGNYHNTKKIELLYFQKGRPVRKFRKKNMLKDLHHILPGSFSNIIHVLQSFTFSTLLLFPYIFPTVWATFSFRTRVPNCLLPTFGKIWSQLLPIMLKAELTQLA